MQQALQRSSLVPRGFVVESAYYEGDKAVIAVRASGSVGLYPSCGTVSRRVHSRYRRHVTDLPLSGRIVQLRLDARRGWTLSSIILVWRLADDRRQTSQKG
jgi:hypothetical protein